MFFQRFPFEFKEFLIDIAAQKSSVDFVILHAELGNDIRSNLDFVFMLRAELQFRRVIKCEILAKWFQVPVTNGEFLIIHAHAEALVLVKNDRDQALVLVVDDANFIACRVLKFQVIQQNVFEVCDALNF